MKDDKISFSLKLQDATVEVERLGELFLINRQQVRRSDRTHPCQTGQEESTVSVLADGTR